MVYWPGGLLLDVTVKSAGNRELQGATLSMSPTEARERGIGKSAFHYLRKNAESGRSFRTYGKVLTKLQRRKVRLEPSVFSKVNESPVFRMRPFFGD
jgi:hypothetical protein